MKIGMSLGLVMCLNAGGVVAGEETPTRLEASRARVVDVAHIYYNIATGERVVTLTGSEQTAGADTGAGGPIWSTLVNTPCAYQGFGTELFFELDNNANSTSLATAVTLSDMGDIATNTVVDCVHLNWVTDHDDVDNNSDGVGDGVEGLGGQWIWYDTDNARAANCNRTALIHFTFLDLPGDISGTTDPADPLNVFAKYTMDVDLASSFSNSLTFEICDTDSDLNGAATHNAGIGNLDNDFDGLPDSDLDGDGLADWTWNVRFFQPGTEDIDGDGVIDGDIADSFKGIGVSFGLSVGDAIVNGDGNWEWVIDTSVYDAGTGSEDAFALYAPPDLNGDVLHAGFFWFGGFACVEAPNPGDGYNPAAMFEHQLFAPSACSGCRKCPADLNFDAVYDFFDVSLFLAEFSAGGDYNGDGVTNFFDVSLFLSDFGAGCP